MGKRYLLIANDFGIGELGLDGVCFGEFDGKIGTLHNEDKGIDLGRRVGKSVYLQHLQRAKVNRIMKDFAKDVKSKMPILLNGINFYFTRFFVVLRFNESDLSIESKDVKPKSAIFNKAFDVCIVGAFTHYQNGNNYYSLIDTSNGQDLLKNLELSEMENIENLLNN